ncbi:MAG: hypothetical protein MJE12_20055, partial [Alphaproteobacteria bacterium]|nr:hypothetical protein [Alphaproteobacteria bacterium]
MDQVRRVTDRWDDCLAKFDQLDIDRLDGAQRERGLLKDDRPLCAVARPHFVADGELSRHRRIVD